MEGTRGSLAGFLVPVSDPESTDRAFFGHAMGRDGLLGGCLRGGGR